jgi:hypothetical protein
MFELAIHHCINLYRKTVDDDSDSESTDKKEVKKMSAAELKAINEKNTASMSEMEKLVYSTYNTIESPSTKVAIAKKKSTDKSIDLEEIILEEFIAYRQECAALDIHKYIVKYPSKKYLQMMEKNQTIDEKKISPSFMDIPYITSLSDVTLFWKEMQSKYCHLSTAALIFLGKPTHNAFQERVFSRGTYTDTKLKKKLTETSFEISVLNAVNNKQLQDLKETIKDINKKIDKDLDKKKKMMQQCKELEKFLEESDSDNESVNDNEMIENIDGDISVHTIVSKLNDCDNLSIESDNYEDDDVPLEDYFSEYKNTTNEDLVETITQIASYKKG